MTDQSHSRREPDTTLLSRSLGWFGIALGMTGLRIPRMLAKAIERVTARRGSRVRQGGDRSARFARTIDRPPAEVYAFCRRLSRFPLFMNYLALVREADDTYAHWVARLPGGGTVAWDTKIVEDHPGEQIAWRSVEGSLIQARGTLCFAGTSGGNATEVRIQIQLDELGNTPSKRIAEFFTTAQIEGDLRRLEQAIEAAVPRASTAGSW